MTSNAVIKSLDLFKLLMTPPLDWDPHSLSVEKFAVTILVWWYLTHDGQPTHFGVVLLNHLANADVQPTQKSGLTLKNSIKVTTYNSE